MPTEYSIKEVFEKHEKSVNERFDRLEAKIDGLGEHEHRDYIKASVAYGLLVGLIFLEIALLALPIG